MLRNTRLRLALAVVLGGITVLAGLGLALPLSWPRGWRPDQPRLATVSEARALAAADDASPDLRAVERATRATLAERPLDAAAWARLAWVADQQGKSADMLDALDRSYVAAPYGPEITTWRLRFALDRWSRLSPDLRQQVLAELRVAARTRPALVREVHASLSDSTGRMALTLGAPDLFE